MKSMYEQMGGTYTQVGDYFIPDLTLPDMKEYHLRKYGRMRRQVLKGSLHPQVSRSLLP